MSRSSVGDIVLTIHKAEQLVALNPGGTSNPYITATIDAQSVSTPVVSKTVNPLFDSVFTFASCPLPAVLTLKVFNKLPYVDVEDALGSASVTIFGIGASQSKTVALSHGGNAALAQRAPNGCGNVFIRYEVNEATPLPPPAAASLSTSVVPPAAPVAVPEPLSPPPAVSITGVAARPASVRSSPCSSSSSLSSNNAVNNRSLVSTAPIAQNPAAISPKGVPEPSNPGLLPPSLLPPALTPAKEPVTLGYLVPQSAPAAPLFTSPAPMADGGAAAFVSYPVAGLNMETLNASHNVMANSSLTQFGIVPSPSSVPAVAAAPQADAFYANNNTTNTSSIAVPPALVAPPVTLTAATPPAAVSPGTVVQPPPQQSLHSSSSLARSTQHSAATTPSSTIYHSATHAPPVSTQQGLVVLPPHIEGTHSAPPSRLPSAGQQQQQQQQHQPVFLSQPARPLSTSATVVATAPRVVPLTSSTTNSRLTTPGSGAPAAAPTFPASKRQFAKSATTAATGPFGAGGGAAHTRPRSSSPEQAAATSARPPRPSPSARKEAHQIYADPEYLFAAAAKGSDMAVFQEIRSVDPQLSNGFAQCVDYAGRSLLHVAAWHGQLHVMHAILASNTSGNNPLVDLRSLVTARSGNTVMHAAACGGQAAVAQWLRQSYPLLLPCRNTRGMTAAECAKEAGFDDVARLLLPF